MKKRLIGSIIAASLGFGALSASPALADPPRHAKAHGYDKHRKHDKHRDYDRHRGYDRTVIIHRYDYNRPDPRYHGYYADRYYRGGYAPIAIIAAAATARPASSSARRWAD